MTRTRRFAAITWWAAIVINGAVLVFDLVTGSYHLAAAVAVVLCGLGVMRHLLEQTERRLAARISQAESEATRADYEQQTAKYVLTEIQRGTAQILVERQRPH